ncbi:hypothetical protein BU24DRAFT_142693 [Aaosphaeria arxii CBS 175.79]|uniref:Uncharacterized protein n=1 Tax=Aaosphaeria arxii CBS 175.79 TaxID=1450172 RepID=A0A6A5XUR6_9PLEO|nr:uncharacterized protein BU24DRAFT_142693 [Aaosphaeria arxii CBS 175.79]KAF2017058.1 hypothetical protein BU24DRAFT_142693 [Aaosphaeria arxii CBS 175.79]
MQLHEQHSQGSLNQQSRSMTRKQMLQNRRKTLQTVDELSSQLPESSDWDSASRSGTTNTGSMDSRISQGLSDSSEKSRRERPRTFGYGHELQSKPSIVITEAEPLPARRSLTAPVDWQQEQPRPGQTNESDRNRLSAKHAPGTTSKQGNPNPNQQRRHSGPGSFYTSISSTSRQNQSTQQIRASHSKSIQHHNQSADRQRNQNAQVKPHADKQRQRIHTGSSSVLPSLSPFPITKPSAAQIRGYGNQQQLLQNSRSMNQLRSHQHLNKRTSQARLSNLQSGNASVDAQLLQQASGNKTAKSKMPQDPISRPRSTQYATLPIHPQGINQNHQMPPLFRTPRSMTSPPPGQYNFPLPPASAVTSNRASRSSLPGRSSNVRSSSAHSTMTAATSASAGTNRSSKSRKSTGSRNSYSGQSHRHQQGVTQEHLEALAALTGASPTQSHEPTTPESIAFQRKLDEKMRRASVGSEHQSRASYGQQTKQSSKAGSRVSAHSYATTAATTATRANEQAMTPESVRLLREREKLLRWKAEREKKEFERREREKIRERVRRANALELEKTIELEKQQKKEKRKRGCLGFLGL